MISSVFLVVFITYAVLVALLTIGWRLAVVRPAPIADQKVQLSVLIAARNEQGSLPFLIADLRAQQYVNFEVIIIDDHSEDHTMSVCRNVIADDPRFRLVAALGQGKKMALTQGVGIAQGKLIVTTDADCRVGAYWLQAMSSRFAEESVMFCFGPVQMSGPTIFDRAQSMEFATLVGSAAATATWGKPTMCNGANLAYRKAAFNTVQGYVGNAHIASGDDEFLMRKIDHHFPGSVRFCGDTNSVVTTTPSPTLGAFIKQRVRWAGKWKANSGISARLLALGVFAFHLCLLALPFLLATQSIKPSVFLLCIFLKVFAEFCFMSSLGRIIPQWSWPAFFLLQVVYSFYVVFIGLWSQFAGFEWKGRRP